MKNFYEKTPMPKPVYNPNPAQVREFLMWLQVRGALTQIEEHGWNQPLFKLVDGGNESCFLAHEMEDLNKWASRIVNLRDFNISCIIEAILQEWHHKNFQETINNGDYALVKIDVMTKKVLSVKKVPPPSSGKNKSGEKSMLFRKGDTPCPILTALDATQVFINTPSPSITQANALYGQILKAQEVLKQREEEERMRHIFDLRNARKVLGRYQRTAEEPMIGMIGDAVNVIDDVLEHIEQS